MTDASEVERREAAELNDRIRVRAPPGWDSTEAIRQWRDDRDGHAAWKARSRDRSR